MRDQIIVYSSLLINRSGMNQSSLFASYMHVAGKQVTNLCTSNVYQKLLIDIVEIGLLMVLVYCSCHVK